MINFLKQRLRRMGSYRVIHSRYKWGFDLFDDLDKLRDPRTVRTIFDVGANYGYMARLFLRHFPLATVHAFEPVRDTFLRLSEAFGDNPRAKLHPFAASDSAGTATIRTFVSSASNTMVTNLSDHLRIDSLGTEKIEAHRLDELIPTLTVNKIDLLKIDVEGYEKNVLLGCGPYLDPSRIEYIFFECHRISESGSFVSGHTKLAEIDELLGSRGYRFITLYTEALARVDPIGSYNALYGPRELKLTVVGPPTFG